jgi:hypothetical protein
MEHVYAVDKSLAARISALHYCYTHERLRPYVSGMQLFFAEQDRYRIRPFMGDLKDIMFQLQTYGIPMHLSPVQDDGSWSVDWLHETLQAQRLKEEKELKIMEESASKDLLTAESHPLAEPSNDPVPTVEPGTSVFPEEEAEQSIVIPRRFDVILGKTSQARVHTGNRRAIHLCHMNYEAYEQAGKFKKTEVAERIVSIIRQSGGRFVRWEEDEGGWVEDLDEIIARKKIGHFLRYMRSKVNKSGDTQPQTADEAANSSKDSSSSSKRVASAHSPEAASKRVTPPQSPVLDRFLDEI